MNFLKSLKSKRSPCSISKSSILLFIALYVNIILESLLFYFFIANSLGGTEITPQDAQDDRQRIDRKSEVYYYYSNIHLFIVSDNNTNYNLYCATQKEFKTPHCWLSEKRALFHIRRRSQT